MNRQQSLPSVENRLRLTRARNVWLLVVLLTASTGVAAQQEKRGDAPAPAAASRNRTADSAVTYPEDAYRIGRGDVLQIVVFNRPQLTRDVRVDGRGMIHMPLIEEEIQAACRTEAELAKEIATRYLEYQRNPQVDVFIKEYQSQPVAVIGAVTNPGRFQLQRRIRLLELLTNAGGPVPDARGVVQVIHSTESVDCNESSEANQDVDPTTGAVNYKLSDVLNGDVKMNPYVRPGDIVTLPRAEQAYVVGQVIKPQAVTLTEPITVARAIAMSGGMQPGAQRKKIRVVRENPGSKQKTEFYVNLDAVNKRQAEDIVLQPNDIVEVAGKSGGFTGVLREALKVVVPSAGLIRIIH